MNHFLFLIAVTCLSQSPTWVRIAAAPALALGFWRLFGASILMLGIAILSRDKTQPLRNIWPQSGKKETIMSGVFFFLHLWTYTLSAQNTTIANCMILFSLNPLFTAVGSYLIFKEKFTPRLGFAYIFAALAIYNLFAERIDFRSNGTFGDVSAIAAAALYSAYIISSKRARRHMPNPVFSVGLYSSAALLFLATALTKQIQLLNYPMNTWAGVAGLIVFSTLLGHGLFTYLLGHLNINWMSCGKLIEPAIASLVAFLIFGEALSSNTIKAFALTATAVVILFAPWKTKKT